MPLDGNPAKYAEPLAPVDEDAAIRERAAQILEKRGWQQRDWGEDDYGPRCIGGAVAEACRDLGYWRYIPIRQSLGGEAMISWNNEDGRTAAEVIALLRGRP